MGQRYIQCVQTGIETDDNNGLDTGSEDNLVLFFLCCCAVNEERSCSRDLRDYCSKQDLKKEQVGERAGFSLQ